MITATLVVVFVSTFALCWRGGLRWWSLLPAAIAALLTAEIYRRLGRARRRAADRAAAQWTVLYRDEAVGWRVLVGGERCSRSQADAARRELESRGYQVQLLESDQLDRRGLPRSIADLDRREEAGGAGS